jgi:hypothetical protein
MIAASALSCVWKFQHDRTIFFTLHLQFIIKNKMRVARWFDSTTGHAVNNLVFLSPSWAHRAAIETGDGAHLSAADQQKFRIRGTRGFYFEHWISQEKFVTAMLLDSCGFSSGGGRGPSKRPEVGPWWGTKKITRCFRYPPLVHSFLMAPCIGLSYPNTIHGILTKEI